MSVQDLATTRLAIKAQAGLGTPASGSGAIAIPVLPSSGLALSAGTIESEMIQRNLMRKRPRQGAYEASASYETELVAGLLDDVFASVLGATWQSSFELSDAELGDLAISGDGTTLTFDGIGYDDALLAEGIVAGMWARLDGMSEAGNNGVWFPILGVNGLVVTTAAGFLVNNSTDSSYDIQFARTVYTPADSYAKVYHTIEEHQATIGKSKVGEDMLYNSLGFNVAAGQMIRMAFGFGGRQLSASDSEVFTDPTSVSGDSLVLLDGGVYVNGTKRPNLTGLQWSLSANVTTIPVIGSKLSPSVFLGQFSYTGQFTSVVEDLDDLESFLDEDDVSILLHCKEKSTDRFVSFYIGKGSLAGYSTPTGGEGAQIATIPLYGGVDDRGDGYAPSTIVVATNYGMD